MKKLLHERLREISIDDEDKCALCKKMHNDSCPPYLCDEAMVRGAHKLADEIERYYIPRPRFEDGEPVQFGDEFIVDRYMQEPEKLTRLAIFTEEWLEDHGQYYGVAPVYEINYCRPRCDDGKEPVIKRPSPKVLDADGVEIKVGDTVWNLDDVGKCGTVKRIENDSFNAGKKLVCCVDETGHIIFAKYPENLTHKEPDSLEKLLDDISFAREYIYETDISVGRTLHGYEKRLSALIERDKQ